MQVEDTAELLRQGITAARAGQRSQARALLQRVVALDAANVTGWLWLAGVMETPQEQVMCLEQVLSLDPENAAAKKGLVAVREHLFASLVREGNAALEQGDKARAQDLFIQVVDRDEDNLAAWLGLCKVVDSSEELETCYENVLILDPENTEAREELARLRAEKQPALFAPPSEGFRETAWGDLPPEDAALEETPWSRYEDETLCPYCAAPTAQDDRHCPHCGHPLWMKLPRHEKASGGYWVLVALQLAETAWSGIAPFVAISLVGTLIGVEDFGRLFSIYWNGDGGSTAAAALQILPRWGFFLMWLPFFPSLLLCVGILLRWPVVFYLLLAQAVLGFFLSVMGVLSSPGPFALVPGIVGVLISLGIFLFVLRLADDFLKDRRRILLQMDRGLHTGEAYMTRGQLYASNKMWALAAVHFHRAAGMLEPRPAGHLALAQACIHLGEYDLAAQALEAVQRLAPGIPQLAELTALLEAKRSGGHSK